MRVYYDASSAFTSAKKTCLVATGWHNTVIKIDCSSPWGWTFLGALVLCTSIYILLGVFGPWHRGKVAGLKPSEALRLHPHYRSWQQAAGLIADGIVFTQRALTGQRSREVSSKQVNAFQARGARTSIPRVQDSGTQAQAKIKKQHKQRSKKKKSGCADDLSLPLASAPAESARSAGTAAGGGGRWVHVAS